jgi:hypothetical protein
VDCIITTLQLRKLRTRKAFLPVEAELDSGTSGFMVKLKKELRHEVSGDKRPSSGEALLDPRVH